MKLHRFLITGGCGFIGTNLIAHITKHQEEPIIRVLDNESGGTRDHIKEFDVEFIPGDICDPETVMMALDSIDAVVHLAADTRVMESIEDPSHNFECNVVGTFNLLMCMRKKKVMTLINASTGGAILGDVMPPVHEDMVARPVSPYGASKLATEGYSSAFSGAYGLAATTLRFSNVYGPRSYHKGSVIAHFFKRILAGQELEIFGDGGHIRDYVYVGDLCSGIWQALYANKNSIFQLGTGRPTTINELVELIKKTVGKSNTVNVSYKDPRPGEVLRTWCDISKAQRELQFHTPTTLEEGLKHTWKWFLENNAA